MTKMKIIVPGLGDFEIDPADFDIEFLEFSKNEGKILGIRIPEKYPKLANLLAGNRLQNLEYIVFSKKIGEQK